MVDWPEWLSCQPANTSNLDFLQLVNSWRQFANSYKTAADVLVEHAMSHPGPFYTDGFLYPIAFQYRHYLELSLKGIIRSGVSVALVIVNDDRLNKHNLHKLWNKARKVLDQLCDESDAGELRDVEETVLALHAIDKSSCEFRYPTANDGSRSLDKMPPDAKLTQLLKDIDFTGMKAEFESVHAFLEKNAIALDCMFDDSDAFEA